MFTLLIKIYNSRFIKPHFKLIKYSRLFLLMKSLILSGHIKEYTIKFKLKLILFKLRYKNDFQHISLKIQSHNKDIFYRASNKPIIRWVKGDGLDDEITKFAIGQATRLFGDQLDYCITTNYIGPERARDILSLASEPVEWIPVSAQDNKDLAKILFKSGCKEKNFGYWWKWFPSRVRLLAPEWVLDGDMVIINKPDWFDLWRRGNDFLRVSQVEDAKPDHYGEFAKQAYNKLNLYSGIISLPPRLEFNKEFKKLMTRYPLKKNHNGTINMSEQGVVAAVFSKLKAMPIPINDFPFVSPELDNFKKPTNAYEVQTKKNWGYHFTRSFVLGESKYFKQYSESIRADWQQSKMPSLDKYLWLRNHGQQGIEGSSTHLKFIKKIYQIALAYKNKAVLEIGTSRGYLSAILSESGCLLTTVDREDRGASLNLRGLNIKVIHEEIVGFLKSTRKKYSLIIVDLHGNSPKIWKILFPLIETSLNTKGKFIFYNSHLKFNSNSASEDGIWYLVSHNFLRNFSINKFAKPWPGMIVGVKKN